MTVIEKNAAFAGVRKASKMEELALTVVMAASPIKGSKAFKDATKLLAANKWTPEERSAWVAYRNMVRKNTMAGVETPEAPEAPVKAIHFTKEDADRIKTEREKFLADAAKADAAKEAIEKAKEAEAVAAVDPVTDAELAAAMAIIARATKQQAEAIRKAAAERKKEAPEGEKVKKEKTLTAEQQKKADQLAADLKRLGNVIGLIGAGKAGDMALAVAGIKTPDVKLVIKHHNPKFKLSGMKVAELRAELIGYSDIKHAKPE